VLTLYALPISVYSAKVRLALRIKGIAFEELPPPDGYGSETYRAIIASGTIPAIVTGHGALFESDAIIEYLEEEWPQPTLMPDTALMRARARAASGYHDTRVEPLVRKLFPYVGSAVQNHEEFARAAALLQDRLSRLAQSHQPAPYLAGDRLSLADLGYPATLMMAARLLDHGGSKLVLPPELQAWQSLLLSDDLIADQVSSVEAALNTWIASKNEAA
jgi:glutathione S-transferase/maleylpyruvate isomerase